MQDDEIPTDEQLERALASSDAPPTRREWNTEAEWRRLRARIAADDQASTDDVPRHRLRLAPWRRWLTAAAVVVAAGGGVWTARRVAAPSALTVSTGRGERRSIQLDDGTRVTIGPSSSVRVTLSRRARRAELSGLAQFSVTHDGSRPFVVRAGETEATDLGTVFTIRAFPDDSTVTVGVTEGRVSLRARDDSLALAAGQSGRAGPSGVARVELPASRLAEWAAGRLSFHDAPIGEVALELSRWFDVDVRVDRRLASRRVSGSYANPSLSGLLATMARATGARVDRDGDAFVLRPDTTAGAR
ncbi:MAG TPA: FecR domain-containing protein [Gemmatimonadaceae bacterium]|nr:FecR domain-containing protein [Gemmatimonadaceae bacterium]